MFIIFSFIFLTLFLLSLWIRKDPKVWVSLLSLSLLAGWIGGLLQIGGLILIGILAILWILYIRQKTPMGQFILFAIIVIFSFTFKFEAFSQFPPLVITPYFKLGLSSPMIGLFPLALIVPLSRSLNDWKLALKGALWGCLVIIFLALIATTTKVVSWQMKIPSFILIRYWANLFLTSIPEEGFFRGFVQNSITSFLQGYRGGKYISLFITSILFTLAHIYWSPNLSILLFVFFAGLLYGGVYLYSGKIESAIFTHFLLNATHMALFSYHAM